VRQGAQSVWTSGSSGPMRARWLAASAVQGLGSYTQSKTYDIQIFSLAVLLASLFIYNSMGSIDETALDRLSYVAVEPMSRT